MTATAAPSGHAFQTCSSNSAPARRASLAGRTVGDVRDPYLVRSRGGKRLGTRLSATGSACFECRVALNRRTCAQPLPIGAFSPGMAWASMKTPTLVAQPTRFLNSCPPHRVRADAIVYSDCESIRVKALRTIGCTEGRSVFRNTELRCMSLAAELSRPLCIAIWKWSHKRRRPCWRPSGWGLGVSAVCW